MLKNEDDIRKILETNEERRTNLADAWNPVTGENSIGSRTKVEIPDFPIPVQWLPKPMLKNPLVKKIRRAGSLEACYKSLFPGKPFDEKARSYMVDVFVRIRILHDFAFWAVMYVVIKNKGGGEDVPFRLNHAQRMLVEKFEQARLANKPIRLVLLKARQWGGSTCTQIYMAWLQLVHKRGLNSLIVGHVKDTSIEVKDMFDRLISNYPVAMLHQVGEPYVAADPKMVGVGNSGNIHRVPARKFKIKIGTAERPDGARGGDYNLVHCTEVAKWKVTDGKTPEQIVTSACSGVLYKPYTMIVYESTANGTGDFFQREYDAAKNGRSQFAALFVAWHNIEQNQLEFPEAREMKLNIGSVPLDREEFARWLWQNRKNENVNSNREESGKYLWWLWQQGATLEGILWYVVERSAKNDHASMATEAPTDDSEAFVYSGDRVFDRYQVEEFRPGCRPPKFIGDIYGNADEGEEALKDIKFKVDHQGLLWIWQLPEREETTRVLYRYLVVVDIGGRSSKADWSVIVVFDRLNQIDGGVPSVVAQWYGHIDMDLLAWKAAQIASMYDNALLVIESNTLETKDKERYVDGDQSYTVLNEIKGVYDNLYARKQSDDEIREGKPVRYGFHTNVSTKPVIISVLQRVVREHLYIERDERCLDEYLCYERKPNGAYGAVVGKHDDLLMTRAIGMRIAYYEMELPRIIDRHASRLTKRIAKSEASII